MALSQIDTFARVTLDGSGNGQVSIGPPSGTKWSLSLASLAVAPVPPATASSKTPTGALYRGSASGPIQLVDSTLLGNSAASAKVGGLPYFQGQRLWAVWAGGDPGAIATLQVYGQQGLRTDPFDQALFGEGFAPTTRSLTLPNGAGAGTARIVIGPDLPPPLNTYVFNIDFLLSGTADAAIIFYSKVATNDTYNFIAHVTTSTQNTAIVSGSVVAGSVIEAGAAGLVAGWSVINVVPAAPTNVHTDLMGPVLIGPPIVGVPASVNSYVAMQDALLTLNPGGLAITHNGINDFLIEGRSQPRGLIDENHATASSAAIGNVETVIFTGSSKTFRNGRAFEIRHGGFYGASAAALTATLRVRRNNVAGTLLNTTAIINVPNAGLSPYYQFDNLIFINNSGADITDNLVLTMQCGTAGQTVTQQASSLDQQRYFRMYDAGYQGDFAGVQL